MGGGGTWSFQTVVLKQLFPFGEKKIENKNFKDYFN